MQRTKRYQNVSAHQLAASHMYKTVRASTGTESYDPANHENAAYFTSTKQHSFAQCGTVLKTTCTLLYQIARAERCDLVRVLFAARPHTLNYRAALKLRACNATHMARFVQTCPSAWLLLVLTSSITNWAYV